jgi:hypothetical protein
MTPIAYFEAVWSRCAGLSAMHAYLANNVSGALQTDDLLRAEWVSRVSALDLYVHELVAQRMLEIFVGQRAPTPAYLKFQVSTETLDRVRVALHPSAPNSAAAAAAFDLEVRNQLSTQTFQVPDKIADGIRLCSSVELWNDVAVSLGASQATKTIQAKAIKQNIALIAQRRNKIAHEGDLQPILPRLPWPISQSDVTFVTIEIERVVRAIDVVV